MTSLSELLAELHPDHPATRIDQVGLIAQRHLSVRVGDPLPGIEQVVDRERQPRALEERRRREDLLLLVEVEEGPQVQLEHTAEPQIRRAQQGIAPNRRRSRPGTVRAEADAFVEGAALHLERVAGNTATGQRIAVQQIERRSARGHQHGLVEADGVIDRQVPAALSLLATAERTTAAAAAATPPEATGAATPATGARTAATTTAAHSAEAAFAGRRRL